MSVQQKNYRKSFGAKGGSNSGAARAHTARTRPLTAAAGGGGGGGGGRGDAHRDGPLRNSMGQVVKETKPKGGAFDDKRGGGKKGEWVERRVWTREEIDAQDLDFGYDKFVDGGAREGWLITFSPTTISHPETNKEISAVECYLTMQDGSKFKCLLLHKPYFYVSVVEINRAEMREIDNVIRKKYSDFIVDTQVVEKEDLDLPNHLSGIKQTYLKIIFDNTKDLVAVRNELLRIINRNKDRGVAEKAVNFDGSNAATVSLTGEGLLDCLIDIREYDVPYHMRVCIDLEIRVGKWYDVSVHEGFASFNPRDDLDKCIGRADPVTLAWDIECTKKPLKFPDAKSDEIFMISYMVDGQGFLIISRDIVSSDIQDFEYTPKPEFEGPFTVFNEPNELGLIHRFLEHIRELKPSIFVTYNGDFFDWPFLNDRCKHHGISLEDRIGFSVNQEVYTSRFAVHIDCFAWVQRDSYLPQGSQGLKAVTRAKLDYEPVEVDPEEMVAFAQSNPQTMATYSVSDAVATYYLYQKYVQPFIFSLCNIIPMTPDDVLRKGSGTLCEVLLMVSAFRGNIICPNKTVDDPLMTYGDHVLDTQTYVGGHVEALQSGVYRSDLKYKFKMDPSAFDELIENLDRDLEYALKVGHRVKREDVINYEEKRQEILDALLALKGTPRREENPLIIHLDVGAMYPNIILSNRLQPPAMVKPETCAACDYFSSIGECRRDMEWVWRAEAFPATKADVRQLRGQMAQEAREQNKPEPSIDEIKVRIRKYSQMVYKKQHKTIHETRTSNVCQRENPFYVNTVLEFKERRMVYKGEKKTAEGRLKKAMAEKNALDVQTAEKMVVLYESLQLAHKCILNSFYGYVMRKGARWYSMEMAGVVTHLGAKIIRMARELIERIGIPLELDTDGIWCCLPASFPQGIKFVVRDPSNPGKTKNAVIQYGCEMLNAKLEEEFTNHQYHVLDPETGKYSIKSECSIAFELDGPYLAMILPASTQEDKRLKKRYAVFNHNKTLAELKGFEIKRRGELQLIKNFQEMVFKRFLDGGTLEECYSAVSNVANEMLDIIDERGQNMEDEALLNIISESSTMSRAFLDYGAQKSCAITTAKRLGEVLGEDTVRDKGLACRYIISKLPEGSPVTERAVPVKIFMMDKSISLACLKRWLKDSSLKGDDVDIRNVLDWGYYRERLANCIAKIVTIPAAMQGIVNPVPRVPHPEWLQKRIAANDTSHKQTSISSFFSAASRESSDPFTSLDMEDLAKRTPSTAQKKLPIVTKRGKGSRAVVSSEPPEIPSLALKNSNYKLWLSQMKDVWIYNMERKKLRLSGVLDFDTSMAPRRNAAGVSSFIAGRARNIMQQSWQIIEICETQLPGQLKLWIYLPDGSMEQLLLNMDRTLYMNFRKPKHILGADGSPLPALNRRLPFRRPTLNLYEVAFSEEEFQKKSDSIRQSLADPDVEGVYESKTPLVFRAVSEIGAVARYKGSSRSQSQLASIRLADVQMLNTLQCPYLQSSQPKCMYLHVLCTEKQGVSRLMASLWAPMGDSKGYIVCMNNGISSKESAAMSTLYSQRVTRLPVELRVPSFVYPDHIEFELKSVPAAQNLLENGAAVSNFWKQVSNIIQSIIGKKLGPMVLVHSTPFSSLQLKSHIAAASDLPVIPILYEDAVFAPFLNAPAKIIDRFLQAPWFFSNFISIARQLHIPVGNLQLCTQFGALDIYTAATDVLFSRLLRQHGYIWWASPSGIADFGGNETSFYACADIDLEHVEIARKGSYRSFCISLEIGQLAVAAILNFLELEDVSNLHEAAEAPTAIPYDGSTPAVDFLIDDTISSIDTFKVLNTLIRGWILQLQKDQNVMSEKLLSSIYRWSVGNSSMFRAPILKQYLQRNMQKVLTELITHVQNLGGYVVFASFNKLIVKTTKPTIVQAKQYCNFLIRSIHDDSRFKCLQVSPTSYWSWLLLLDGHNFGGYLVENAIGANEDSSLSQAPRELPGVASYWNLAEHLPQLYKPIFHELIRRFVEAPYNERINRFEAGSILSLPGAGPLQASQASPTTDSPTTDHDLKTIVSLVRTDSAQEGVQAELVRRIFQLVSAARSDTSFNSLPSNRHSDLTPALAFVNYFCEVASLEPEIVPDIINVKRQVLSMLQVKEFSPIARFENPAPKLILPAVFCPLCSHGQDIDLCRDHGALSKNWKCINCSHSLDFDAVHSLLFESVRRLVLLSQTQDVVCVKCKQSQNNPLMTFCKCSGKFEPVLPKQDIEKKLRAIAQVAQYYEMHLLSEQVQWALSV